MGRYIYSIIRCLPEPRTGEFMNVGAVVGDPTSGDWSIRQLSRTDRARRFAGDAFEVAISFINRLGQELDARQEAMERGGDPLGEEWLTALHHDHRGIVQLSPPAPLIAEDSTKALELIFTHMIVETVAQPRQAGITRNVLTSSLREAYRQARIADDLIRPRAFLHVGGHVRARLDFAIANGRAVQLTQAWSFRLADMGDVATHVKAWGYALERFREGDPAQVIDANGNVSTIDPSVDLQVVVATPETPTQRAAYNEAEQVFQDLGAKVHPLEEVAEIGRRAAELIKRLR